MIDTLSALPLKLNRCVQPSRRTAFLCMVLGIITSMPNPAFPDVIIVEDNSSSSGTLYIYKMTITPSAEASPAFIHRLTIEPHKTIAANAATNYLRSFGEKSLDRPWDMAREKFGDEIHDWYGVEFPIKDLPLEKVKEAAGYFDGYVNNHIRRATKCRYCDWGLAEEDLTGFETIEFLLPSIQQTRSISRALALRTKLAIAEGRYEDAIDHMRMNYQLGQNVAKMKFLVSGLVGISEVGIANQNMIDFIAAPNSPNMYWALAELPTPVIELRDSIRLEMSIGSRIVPIMLNAASEVHSDKEWAMLYANAVNSLWRLQSYIYDAAYMPPPPPPLAQQMLATLSGLSNYSKAKNRLVEAGFDAAEVESMAVGQVMLIDSGRDYQVLADEYEKAVYVPFRKSRKMSGVVDEQLGESRFEFRFGRMLADMLLPAIEQVRHAQTSIEWQINALMIVEAIRMHLASTGELPKTLDDLQVPTRLNPFTGREYDYRLEGDTAILDMPFSDGVRGMAQRFEIQVAPKN